MRERVIHTCHRCCPLGRGLRRRRARARTMGNDPYFSEKKWIPFYCISGILRIVGEGMQKDLDWSWCLVGLAGHQSWNFFWAVFASILIYYKLKKANFEVPDIFSHESASQNEIFLWKFSPSSTCQREAQLRQTSATWLFFGPKLGTLAYFTV